MLFLLRVAGGFLGVVAYFLGIRSEVTRSNLARALPELSKAARVKIAILCYANIGLVFFEFMYLRFAQRRVVADGVVFENLSEFKPILLDSAGTILLSGHVADWEWIALSLGATVTPIRVLKKTQRSTMIVRFLETMRTRFGNRMIDVADIRQVFRALQNGECLAILADQAPSPESVRVPFFGNSIPTAEGPARIALRTRAPIVFVQPIGRTRTGYRARFHLIPYDDLADASDENVRILTTRHTALLEKLIREIPAQWVWQHRRWKHAS